MIELGAMTSESMLALGVSGLMKDDAKGVAAELLEALPTIREHLMATPHFGLLQDLVTVRFRRFEYVALQFHLALRLKKNIPGLGLSAEFRVGPRKLSGLELLQLWAVLISAGHLFGTFATERALSYRLQSNPLQLDEFLAELPPALSLAGRQKILTGGMNEFINVLAAWRIVHEQMPSELRQTCIAAMDIYLRGPNDARERRLLALHRRVRQAAYQRLQGACVLPSSNPENTLLAGFVSIGASPEDFFERDGISFDPAIDEATPMFQLVQAVDEFQFRAFFTSKDSNLLVLEHLRDFKHWWDDSTRRGRSVKERVILLRKEPKDWPRRRSHSDLMRPVIRLEMPRTAPWFGTVQAWLGDRSTWTNSNFLLTELPGKPIHVCDVFTRSRLSAHEREHIGRMLLAACSANEAVTARSVARFGLLLLGYALNDDMRPILQPVPSDGAHGLAAIAGSFSELVRLMERHAKTSDVERSREIHACLAALTERRPHDNGLWLGFAGRVLITKAEDDREAPVQELDGLYVRLTHDKAEWRALEHKVAGQGGAEKQLARLRRHLAGRVVADGVSRSNGNTAWIEFES